MSKWPRISNNLINNSIEAMYCAIELHNKPILKYRYETCSILIINAWELLLRAYMYHVIKDKEIIKYLRNSLNEQKREIIDRVENSDIEWKSSFNSLVEKVFSWKENRVIRENLKCVAKLRNDFIHAYISELNPILYSLICKSVIEYQVFLKKNFKKDLSMHSDLVLLPIGFQKPINIADYLSWWANIRTSRLVSEIYKISLDLKNEWIEDSILVNFHISMNTANKVSNPDIVAAIAEEWIEIQKNTTLSFNPHWNPIWSIPVSELEKVFTIPAMTLKGLTKEKSWWLKIQGKVFDPIHRMLKDNNYHQKYWWRRPDNNHVLWSLDWFNQLYSEYISKINKK